MGVDALLRELADRTEVQTDPAQTLACAMDGEVPAAVVLPEDEEAVAAVLAAAARHGAAVAPRGAGTKADLGAPPARVDLVLSTARLNRLVEYEPADLTVTVQAGMPLAALQAVLARHGQMLAVDPPRAGAATVGGVVAANAMGPRRLAYGSIRDLVVGMRVALPDGRRIRCGGRVVKNVAGYDMNKLFIGSLGTLGVITEVTCKVRPLPEAAETLLAGFGDLGAALGCAEALLNSELLPAAVVVLSPGAARRLEAPGPYALAVALEESPANVRYQADRIWPEVARAGGRAAGALAGAAEAGFWEGVRNYGDRSGAALCCKVNTVISGLEGEFRKADTAAADAVAYVGTGHVYLYAPAGDEAEMERTAAAWLRPAEGTAVLERAPAPIRRRLPVWGDPGPAFPFMAGLKRTFDPGGVLNPGRFVGGL